MNTEERLQHWLRFTGLLPPEMRGFIPPWHPDNIVANNAAALDRLAEEFCSVAHVGSSSPQQSGVALFKAIIANAKRRDEPPYPRRPTWSIPARPDDASPGWDNIVRAYEEWLGD